MVWRRRRLVHACDGPSDSLVCHLERGVSGVEKLEKPALSLPNVTPLPTGAFQQLSIDNGVRPVVKLRRLLDGVVV